LNAVILKENGGRFMAKNHKDWNTFTEDLVET